MATIIQRDQGMVNTNEKKRSKKIITLYVLSGIIAAYGAYMIYFNIDYVRDYYTSAGTSITSDLANVIQYIVSNSIDYFIYALMIFLGARILKRTVDILGAQRVSHALDSQSNQTEAAIDKQL